MKLIYFFLLLFCIGNAYATSVDIVYVSDNTTACVYFNNGTTQYQYNETNSLTDDLNTLMLTGTVDNSQDLIENPTIIYNKLIYILGVLFFAFMFILVVWIVKKVIG